MARVASSWEKALGNGRASSVATAIAGFMTGVGAVWVWDRCERAMISGIA
jgi:hypothetical protein